MRDSQEINRNAALWKFGEKRRNYSLHQRSAGNVPCYWGYQSTISAATGTAMSFRIGGIRKRIWEDFMCWMTQQTKHIQWKASSCPLLLEVQSYQKIRSQSILCPSVLGVKTISETGAQCEYVLCYWRSNARSDHVMSRHIGGNFGWNRTVKGQQNSLSTVFSWRNTLIKGLKSQIRHSLCPAILGV